MTGIRCGAATLAIVGMIAFGIADASAESVNEKLNKVSRSIARIKVVSDVCGERFVIDRLALNDVMGRLLLVGTRQFDEPILSARVSDMRLEFISEIRSEGILTWCAEQKGFYKNPDVPEFIGERIR